MDPLLAQCEPKKGMGNAPSSALSGAGTGEFRRGGRARRHPRRELGCSDGRDGRSSAAAATAHRCLVATGSGDPAFVRNFNPYVQGLPSSSFVRGGMYEPLVITTPAGGGREYKWLAQSYTWSKDARTITLNIRRNVRWSDGKPLTAADVVYSLTAGRQSPTMDILGMFRKDTNVASVSQKGSHSRRDQAQDEGLAVRLGQPERDLRRPEAHLLEGGRHRQVRELEPGRFRPVRSRLAVQRPGLRPRAQRALLAEGQAEVHCVEYIQATSNDAALLQIVGGKADWTHNFVPNVEKAYIAKSPLYYHAFYDTTAYPISLMFDTGKYPYSIIAFRKAVSMAIDRQKVSKLGEYGYAPPTDAIGLSQLFPSWVSNKKVKADAKALAAYNPNAAKRMLTSAGFKYSGDDLVDPRGDKVSFTIHVISGWSDWVASLQIITKNLQDIGIDARVKLEPGWGEWFPNATSTKFVTLLWQTAATGSPYGFFFNNMHRNTYLPSGEDAVNTGKFAHFQDPNATRLLNTWKANLKVAGQKKLATQLQSLWLQKLPVIPLFIGPQWSTYSTKYFHCFPTPQNHYVRPIYNTYPENTVLLTTICRGGKKMRTRAPLTPPSRRAP